VVIAIIALLVTMISPGLARIRELARRSVCATNLQALGGGWAGYFSESRGRMPDMFNPAATDCISQFNLLVFTCTNNSWCNAGMLYAKGLVPGERVYICPTLGRHASSWYGDNAEIHRDPGAWETPRANPWPVVNGKHSFMTYGTRRMRPYDDPALAVENGRDDPRDDEIMLCTCGIGRVENPAGFSFMADSFCMPNTALASHVPGVNVLDLAGGVTFYRDDDGGVLYDNGITGWGTAMNWLHDDIWMIIDGHHAPPVGQEQ